MTDAQPAAPAPKTFKSYLEKGGAGFLAPAILISLLIPPLGLLIALYVLFKLFSAAAKSRYLLTATIVLVAALIGATAYVKIYSTHNNAKYKYLYSKLDSYKLPGKQNGVHDGVEFLKPVEFKDTGNASTSTKLNTANLADSSQKAGSNTSLGFIVVSSSSDTSFVSYAGYPSYVKATDALLLKHQGAGYEAFKKTLSSYVQTITTKNFNIVLQQPTALDTANINKDAWEFDFQAISNNKASGYKVGTQVEDGKLVLAFGAKTYYYFILDALDYNWQPNAKVWQQVVDSLKIDQ